MERRLEHHSKDKVSKFCKFSLPVTCKASAKRSKTSASSSNNTDSSHKPRSVAIYMNGLDTSMGQSILNSQKNSHKPPEELVHTNPALPGK